MAAKEQSKDDKVKFHLEKSQRQISDDLKDQTLSEFEIQERCRGQEGNKNNPETKIWFCCKKGKTDSRLLHFLTTVFFSLFIMIFCIIQILRLPNENSQPYISLLTLVFGIFIPAPRVKA